MTVTHNALNPIHPVNSSLAKRAGNGLIMVKFITYKLAFIFVLSLTGCGNMFTKNKSKFHWLATESAPKNYPMRIINGTFYYKNEKGGLYVPTAASIGYFWGTGESTHVVGEDFKPLPDRLDIRFFRLRRTNYIKAVSISPTTKF